MTTADPIPATAITDSELPPLPFPFFPTIDGAFFAVPQMRGYARAAIAADRARNAALVSEAVAGWREACAKIAELAEADDYGVSIADYEAWVQGTFDAAKAIRARTPTQEKPEDDHEG